MSLKKAMATCVNCGIDGYWHDPCCDKMFTIEQKLQTAQKEIKNLKEQLEREKACVDFYADHENWDWDNNHIQDDVELVSFFECQTGNQHGYTTWCSLKPEGQNHNEPCEGYIGGKRARKTQAKRSED